MTHHPNPSSGRPVVQHTPGPWIIRPSKVSEGQCVYSEAYGVEDDYGIGEVWDINGNPENRANAHLIAAAPELLAALQAFADACDTAVPIKLMERIAEARTLAQAAISKALGDAGPNSQHGSGEG